MFTQTKFDVLTGCTDKAAWHAAVMSCTTQTYRRLQDIPPSLRAMMSAGEIAQLNSGTPQLGPEAGYLSAVVEGGLWLAIVPRWDTLPNSSGAPFVESELSALDRLTSARSLHRWLRQLRADRGGQLPSNWKAAVVDTDRLLARVEIWARPTGAEPSL